MISLLFALLLNPDPVVSRPEPRPASPWEQSVRASCGNTLLTITGYGGGRPLDKAVTLLIDGHPITGEAVGQLRDDLSHNRAVYRLQILCGDPGEITVRIDEGEKLQEGSVRYRSEVAFIRGDRLVSYTGFQDGDADSFWFR